MVKISTCDQWQFCCNFSRIMSSWCAYPQWHLQYEVVIDNPSRVMSSCCVYPQWHLQYEVVIDNPSRIMSSCCFYPKWHLQCEVLTDNPSWMMSRWHVQTFHQYKLLIQLNYKLFPVTSWSLLYWSLVILCGLGTCPKFLLSSEDPGSSTHSPSLHTSSSLFNFIL